MTTDHTKLIGGGSRSSGACKPFVVQHNRLLTLRDSSNARYLLRASQNDLRIDLPVSSSLATVLSLPKDVPGEITKEWLSDAVETCSSDDLWHPSFMQGIVFNISSSRNASISTAAEAWLHDHDTDWIHFHTESEIRQGPHIYLDGSLRELVRLYEDSYRTFMIALDPDQQSDFAELDFSSSGNGTIEVAVPSRCRIRTSPEKPLANLRVAVKDSYHLRGVPTSASNRSYRDTYGNQPTTAASVERLVDLGCVIVGKVKMTAFGNWEEPVDYIDFEAPWNPRADGHQSSGGSSSGSAAACAAYDWLDIAMGADTAGSIMRPALWGGVFGLRPSFEAVSSEGMVPMISTLDTPCFMGRDLALCKRFASAWYGMSLKRTEVTFERIVWVSDYWKDIDDTQVGLAEQFTTDLEKTLAKKANKVSFEEDWAANPPAEANGIGLQEYMKPAISNIWYEDYHHFDEFRQRHWELFDKAPYLDPVVNAKWAAASKLTQSQCDEAFGRLKVYRNWFNQKYIDGKPDVIFVLPIENSVPRYRDQSVASVVKPPPGLNSLFLSPVLEAPELIVPVETIPYRSRVSQREERLSFAVGLMSPKGTDLALLDVTIKCLQEAGRPTVVKCGKVPF